MSKRKRRVAACTGQPPRPTGSRTSAHPPSQFSLAQAQSRPEEALLAKLISMPIIDPINDVALDAGQGAASPTRP
jgi:hypothetical protein